MELTIKPFRRAVEEAARLGTTLYRYVEDSLRQQIVRTVDQDPVSWGAVERNRLMDALLQRKARFRIGQPPTRDEMNDR